MIETLVLVAFAALFLAWYFGLLFDLMGDLERDIRDEAELTPFERSGRP